MHRLLVALSFVALPLLSGGVRAQTFEGTIRQRTITLMGAAVDRLLYGDDQDAMGEDAPDDETEEAFVRRMAARLFAVPMDRVVAVAREEDGDVQELSISVKGNRVRADFASPDGGSGFMVLDVGSGTATMVNTEGRFYVQWTQQEMQDLLGAMGLPAETDQAAASAADLVIRELGKTLSIAGAACRGIEIGMPDGGVVWGWVSDDFPEIRRAMQELGRQAGGMFADDEDEAGPAPEDVLLERGFPMRTQRLSYATGSPTYDVEDVLSVDRGTVAASMFEIPAGFTKKSLQELWGQ